MRFAGLVLAASLLPAAAQAPEEAAAARARALAKIVDAGDAAALAGAMTPRFLAVMGGAEGMAKRLADMRGQIGAETALIEERVFPAGKHFHYVRVSRHENAPSITSSYSIDTAMRLDGLHIRPTATPAPTDKLDYVTKATLRLPFARPAGGGGWRVSWGGRDAIANHHVIAHDQRFALDLVVERDGEAQRGDGRRNEDHHCWNEPLLAPADGVIVAAVGDLPDNPEPGKLGPVTGPGNHVMIDHGAGEISLMAHFRQGTLVVAKGDRVRAGQLVGQCGNSGRSFQPHLHYHLQTTPPNREGAGLPVQFVRYESNGRPIARGEPIRGELINPLP